MFALPPFHARPCILLWLGALLALSSPLRTAHAQMNVEALATTVEEAGLHGTAAALLSLEVGNVQMVDVSGDVSLVYSTAHPDAPSEAAGFWFRDRLLSYGNAGFKQTTDAPIANRAHIHIRYTRMQWTKIGGEVFTQVQYDEFRLLERRVLGGAGARFVLAGFPHFSSWFGTGYFVEEEQREIPPEDQPPMGPDPLHMLNHRWSNYLTLMATQESHQLSFINALYVQPRLDNPADIQILNELTMQVQLAEHFSFTLGVSVHFDSRAPRSVSEFDVALKNGITAQY